MDLLVLAFYLSVLTYYLGVLIYMLPIPFYGVKKWAPQLMVDGIFSAILVFSYTTIQWLIEYFSGLLGADWSYYYLWFINEINIVIGTILTLKIIGAGLSSIGLNFLANALISPLISSLTYLLVFIVTVSMLVSLIVTLSPILLALGMVLHALPFRLARSSGATLIAVVIVFSIGTPLMPQFIETISSNMVFSRAIGYGYVLAYIEAYDAVSQPIPYYLYEVYSMNNTLMARYQANEDGLVNTSSISKGIPLTEYIARISLAGYSYEAYTDPRKYVSESGVVVNLTYRLENLVLIKQLRFITLFNYIEFNVEEIYANMVKLTVFLQSTGYMIIVVLRDDQVYTYIDGVEEYPQKISVYEWGGVWFKMYNYTLYSGRHRVSVYLYEGSYSGIPQFYEYYYARDYLRLQVNEPRSLVYPVAILIFRLFIAPMIYLSILFSTAMALSKLLGGSSPKIMRILVSSV